MENLQTAFDFNSIINPAITNKEAISHLENFCSKVHSYQEEFVRFDKSLPPYASNYRIQIVNTLQFDIDDYNNLMVHFYAFKGKNKEQMEILMKKCDSIPVAEILSLIGRQKEIIKELLVLFDLNLEIDKDKENLKEKMEELVQLLAKYFTSMQKLGNEKEKVGLLNVVQQLVEPGIQAVEAELLRLRNELTGLENSLSSYISNNPAIKKLMDEQWKTDPNLLISSFDNESHTVHMISRTQYTELINNQEQELNSLRDSRNNTLEARAKLESEIINLTTLTNSELPILKQKSEEFTSLKLRISNAMEQVNQEQISKTTEFNKNQKIICQILEITGYETAIDLVDDSKRMKLEIKEKIFVDLKFDYNSGFYKRLQNELVSEHGIIMKFLNYPQNINFFKSSEQQKNSLEPLIEEFENLEKEHLCQFLKNDVCDLLTLEELLQDAEVQKEINADEEDLKVMKGHIFQFKDNKMNEMMKPFVRSVINILSMI